MAGSWPQKGLWCWGFGLIAASAQAAPQTVTLSERAPLAFLLATPTGQAAHASSSEVIRITGDLLTQETSLRMALVDSNLVAECSGRLGCITLKLRRDYDRGRLTEPDGRVLPYREHIHRLKRDKVQYPKHLLLFSNIATAGAPDRVSAVLVNTDLALEAWHEASRRDPEWVEVAEGKVAAAAVLVGPIRGEIGAAAETESYLRKLVEAHLRPVWEDAGYWRPYGQVRLLDPPVGTDIVLDGETVGVAAGETLLERVAPGIRFLELRHPNYLPVTHTIEVTRGETFEVSGKLTAQPAAGAENVRRTLLWGGLAVAVAGGALAGWAASRQDSDLVSGCFATPNGSCQAGNYFLSFGYDRDATDPAQVNPNGVLIAPLGYSLAATGAVWSLGALFSEEGKIPWIPLIAGLAVGGLSYGLSAALGSP